MRNGTIQKVLALALLTLAASAAEALAQDLSDAEVAHVAVTANAIDIGLAELALERVDSEGVRSFAQTMIADHTAVNERAAALAQRLGVVPESNAVSASLEAGAAEARQRLEPLAGARFERAYMEREVAYHRAVLEALDELLIPTSENRELRRLLEEVRPAIAAHLEHAESLRGEMGATR